MICKIRPAIIFLILLLIVSLPLNSSYGSESKTLKDIFEDLDIVLDGVDDFIVQKDILRKGMENTFWTIVANKGRQTIKMEVIKNIDKEYAEKYIEEKKYIIESLYRRIPSPYPGMISKSIECPDEFRPEIIYLDIAGKNNPVYLLYSTPRLTYGVCVEELIEYQGVLTIIYNEEKSTIYKIELFIPKGEFEREQALSVLSSFRLQKSGGKQVKKSTVDLKDYNVIMIGFEPLGANHVGAYGYAKNTTPNLDNFSKGAFLFKNAISPSCWTLPAFMSWFTSLYPSQHKLINKYNVYNDKLQILSDIRKLSPSAVTLAQIMKENDYLTAGFTGGAGVSSDFGYGLGFDVYYDKQTFAGFDTLMPRALKWIKKNKQNKFFVFILGYDAHGRYESQKKIKNNFLPAGYRGKYTGTAEEYWELRNRGLDYGYLNLSMEDVEFWRGWYDNKIFEADKRFGEFIAGLDKIEILDKTVIIVLSGSGNEFYEHKRFDHGYSLYDELIKVPLIIKVPNRKGKVIEDQVRMIDGMPTVLDILNLSYADSVKNQMQGISLAPLMDGQDLQLDAFSETDYLLQVFKRSLRTSDGWKFIYSMDTEDRELYNLRSDPDELYNLADKEEKVSYELEQRLFEWLKTVGQNSNYHKEILRKTLTIE